jgi:hypothetical protein
VTKVDAGPVIATLALVAGIVTGERAGAAAATACLVAGLVAGGLAFAVRQWPRAVLAALAFVLLGHGAMQRALDGLEHSPLGDLRVGSDQVVVRGTAADDPDGTRFSTSVTVRVATIVRGDDHAMPLHRLLLVKASGREANELRVVAMGDTVTVAGRLEPLDGFDARARWRHVVARVVDARLQEFDAPTGLLARAANGTRSTVLRGTRALPPDQRALLPASRSATPATSPTSSWMPTAMPVCRTSWRSPARTSPSSWHSRARCCDALRSRHASLPGAPWSWCSPARHASNHRCCAPR